MSPTQDTSPRVASGQTMLRSAQPVCDFPLSTGMANTAQNPAPQAETRAKLGRR